MALQKITRQTPQVMDVSLVVAQEAVFGVWKVVTCLIYVRTSLLVIGMSVGGPNLFLNSLSFFYEH